LWQRPLIFFNSSSTRKFPQKSAQNLEISPKKVYNIEKPQEAQKMSSITIQQKGITDIPADAIVNAANSGLWAGGGVCGAIFRRAGYDKLTAACNAIGHCSEGSAVITPGLDCPCKFIIHAVGPRYVDGRHGEPDALYGAYAKSLELCRGHEIHSVVFPLISAGIFGYPLRGAWEGAARACKDFLAANSDYDLDIIFAIPEAEKVKMGQEVLDQA
jgi:O-acetyl-ADP-ribose deacetylase (regulator of RNase III)